MKLKNKNNEVVEETVVEETPVLEETPVEVVEEETIKTRVGEVTGCTSLYVRQAPHANATPVATIDEKTRVMIYGEEENGFYNLSTDTGIEGYSMSKYIKFI